MQLNINSLSGHYGGGVKKLAEKLVDLDWIDLVGSDCHRIDHLELLDKTRTNQYLHKLVESNRLINKTMQSSIASQASSYDSSQSKA